MSAAGVEASLQRPSIFAGANSAFVFRPPVPEPPTPPAAVITPARSPARGPDTDLAGIPEGVHDGFRTRGILNFNSPIAARVYAPSTRSFGAGAPYFQDRIDGYHGEPFGRHDIRHPNPGATTQWHPSAMHSGKTPIDEDITSFSFLFSKPEHRDYMRKYIDKKVRDPNTPQHEKLACSFALSRVVEAAGSEEETEWFWDFMTWMAGRPRNKHDVPRTHWLMDIFHERRDWDQRIDNFFSRSDECAALMSMLQDMRTRFLKQKALIEFEGPLGNMAGSKLSQCYLYYKYIVRGDRNKDWMRDADLFWPAESLERIAPAGISAEGAETTNDDNPPEPFDDDAKDKAPNVIRAAATPGAPTGGSPGDPVDVSSIAAAIDNGMRSIKAILDGRSTPDARRPSVVNVAAPIVNPTPVTVNPNITVNPTPVTVNPNITVNPTPVNVTVNPTPVNIDLAGILAKLEEIKTAIGKNKPIPPTAMEGIQRVIGHPDLPPEAGAAMMAIIEHLRISTAQLSGAATAVAQEGANLARTSQKENETLRATVTAAVDRLQSGVREALRGLPTSIPVNVSVNVEALRAELKAIAEAPKGNVPDLKPAIDMLTGIGAEIKTMVTTATESDKQRLVALEAHLGAVGKHFAEASTSLAKQSQQVAEAAQAATATSASAIQQTAQAALQGVESMAKQGTAFVANSAAENARLAAQYSANTGSAAMQHLTNAAARNIEAQAKYAGAIAFNLADYQARISEMSRIGQLKVQQDAIMSIATTLSETQKRLSAPTNKAELESIVASVNKTTGAITSLEAKLADIPGATQEQTGAVIATLKEMQGRVVENIEKARVSSEAGFRHLSQQVEELGVTLANAIKQSAATTQKAWKEMAEGIKEAVNSQKPGPPGPSGVTAVELTDALKKMQTDAVNIGKRDNMVLTVVDTVATVAKSAAAAPLSDITEQQLQEALLKLYTSVGETVNEKLGQAAGAPVIKGLDAMLTQIAQKKPEKVPDMCESFKKEFEVVLSGEPILPASEYLSRFDEESVRKVIFSAGDEVDRYYLFTEGMVNQSAEYNTSVNPHGPMSESAKQDLQREMDNDKLKRDAQFEQDVKTATDLLQTIYFDWVRKNSPDLPPIIGAPTAPNPGDAQSELADARAASSVETAGSAAASQDTRKTEAAGKRAMWSTEGMSDEIPVGPRSTKRPRGINFT